MVVGQPLAVRRLDQAARIFSRGRIERLTHKHGSFICAISIGGITIFLDALRSIFDDPEHVGRCYVIQGHIEMHGRFFTYISDFTDFDPEGMDYRSKMGLPKFNEALAPSDLQDGYKQVSLVAMESIDSLQVGWQVQDSNNNAVFIGAVQFTFCYLRAVGLVRCGGRKCFAKSDSVLDAIPQGTVEQLSSRGLAKCWHFRGDTIARIIALFGIQTFSTHDEPFEAILRTQECLACCEDTANILGFKNVIILSKK